MLKQGNWMIQMLNKLLRAGVLLGILLSCSTLFAAPVPSSVHLQVVVGNDSGPIDGVKRVKVLLYSGDVAQPYEETHKSIQFVGGHGVIPIGSIEPLVPTEFDISTPNLRLIIEGEEAYVTLNAVPFSLRAGHAERTSEVLPLTTLVASQSVLVGTPSENAELRVSGDAYVSNRLVVMDNVSIGTSNAEFALDVAGTINVQSIYINGTLLQTASNNATLEDISALQPSTGNIIVGNGIDFVSASGNAARTYLGLGSGDAPSIGGLFVASNDLQVTNNQVRMFSSNTSGLLNVATNNLVVNDIGVGLGVAHPSGSLHVEPKTLFANNGRVGVGTISPQAEFHVSGDLKVDGSIISDSFIDNDWSVSDNRVFAQNKFVGIGTSQPQGPLHIKSSELVLDASDVLPNLKDTFIVTRNRVGIRTANPDGLLHIKVPFDNISNNQLFPKSRFFWVQEGFNSHFVIDQAGNVGVGNVSSPVGRFQVVDSDTNVLVVKDGNLGVGGLPSARLHVQANNETELLVRSGQLAIGTSNPTARVHMVTSGNGTDAALILQHPSSNHHILNIKNNGYVGIGTVNSTSYPFAVSPNSIFLQGLTVTGSSLVMSNPSYNWSVDGGIQLTSINILTSQVTGNRWDNNGNFETTGVVSIHGDNTHSVNGIWDMDRAATFNLVGDIMGLSNTVHINRVNLQSLYNSSGSVVTINEDLRVTGDLVVGNPTIQYAHPDSTRSNLYLDGNLVVDGSIIQQMGMVNSMVDLYVSGNSFIATVGTANAAVGTTDASAKFEIVASSNLNSDNAFLVHNAGLTELFRINNDGAIYMGANPAGVGLVVSADAQFGDLISAQNGLSVTGSAISMGDGNYKWDPQGRLTISSMNIYGTSNEWSSDNMTVGATLNIVNSGTHTVAGLIDFNDVATFNLVGDITGNAATITVSTMNIGYITNTRDTSVTINQQLHVLSDVLIGSPTIRDAHPNSDKHNLFVDGNLIVDGTIVQSMGMLNSMVDLRVSGDATLATVTTANVSVGSSSHPAKFFVLASSNVTTDFGLLVRNSDSDDLVSIANDGKVKIMTQPGNGDTLEVAGATQLGSLIVTGSIVASADETINGIDINNGTVSDVVSLNFTTGDYWSSTGVSVSTQVTVPTLNVTDILINDTNQWLGSGQLTVSESISVATLNIGSGDNYFGNDGSLNMLGTLSVRGAGTHYVNGTMNIENITSFNLSGDIVGGSTSTIKVATADVVQLFNSTGTTITMNEIVNVTDDLIVGDPTIQYGHTNSNKANLFLDGNLVVEGNIFQQGGVENAVADLRVSGNTKLALDSGSEVSIGAASHFARLGIVASSNLGTEYAIWTRSADDSDLFVVQNDGQVMIGTSNASDDQLLVDGSARITSGLVSVLGITANVNETINGIDINAGAISDVTTLTLRDVLHAQGSEIRLSNAGSNGDQLISFFNGTAAAESLLWDDSADSFKLSNDVEVDGTISANSSILLSAGNGNGDQFIYFYDNNNAQGEYLQWNNGVNQDYFELSAGVVIDGRITANTTQTINGISINNGDITDVQTLNIEDSLEMHGSGDIDFHRPIYMSVDGGVGSSGLYFFDDGSATNEGVIWNDTNDRFEITNDVHITGNSDVAPALEVDALGNSDALWVTVAGDGKAGIFDGGSVGIGETNPDGIFHVKSNGADTLVVTNNQVGIGTTDPFDNYILHINGDVRVDGSILATAIGSNVWNVSGQRIYSASANVVGIGVSAPTAKLQVKASSNANTASAFSVINNSNSSLFHVLNDGNIGIAEDSPNSLLHVGSESEPIIFGLDNTVKSTIQLIPHDAIGGKSQIQVGSSAVDTSAVLQISRFDDAAANIERFEVWSNNSYFLGNVGIGETSPDTDLDIVKTGGDDAEISLVNQDGTARSTLTLAAQDSVVNGQIYVDGTSDDMRIRTTTNHPLYLGTNDTDRITITNGGLVGLGTTPTALFQVNNGTVNSLVVSENVVGIGTTDPQNILHMTWDGGDASYSGKKGITIENQNVGASQTAELKLQVGPSATRADVDLKAVRIAANNPAFTVSLEGTERLRLNNYGFLGVGSNNPAAPLHVVTSGGSTLMVSQNQVMVATTSVVEQFASAGEYNLAVGGTGLVSDRLDVGARYDNPGNTDVGLYVKDDIYVSGNIIMTGALEGTGDSLFRGNLTVNGAFSNPSDIRYKQNVESQMGAIDQLMQLRPVTYEFKQDEFPGKGFPDGVRRGFIAQELEEIMPELVNTNDDGYKSVNYLEMISVLVKAVQEQQAEIDSLKEALGKEAGNE